MGNKIKDTRKWKYLPKKKGKDIKMGEWVHDAEASIRMSEIVDKYEKTDTVKMPKGWKFEDSQTILQEAQGIVYGDRQASYGKASTNFGRIARLWEEILDTKITPEQVGMCMIAVKLARQCHKPSRDNLVDIAGYAATIEKVQKGE